MYHLRRVCGDSKKQPRGKTQILQRLSHNEDQARPQGMGTMRRIKANLEVLRKPTLYGQT